MIVTFQVWELSQFQTVWKCFDIQTAAGSGGPRSFVHTVSAGRGCELRAASKAKQRDVRRAVEQLGI